MTTLTPHGTRIVPLSDKLADLNAADVSESWFSNATNVLRGGDGGEHGLLLYKMASRTSTERPSVILDIGTARGFSAITMARALLDADLDGMVYSVDVIDHQTQLVWHGGKHDAEDPLAGISISRSEVWSRWFTEEARRVTPVLGLSHGILEDWSFGPVDVAFIDGEHSYEAVKRDLALLDCLMSPAGIIVLDDLHTGVSMGALRSRPVNGAIRVMARAAQHVWPSMRERLRLGTGNEFLVVKRRYAGVYRAVSEFIVERASEWAIELVSMPARGNYHEADYSLALLTRVRA